MIALTKYRDFIADTVQMDKNIFYIGGINDDDTNVIGIYNLKPQRPRHRPLGNLKSYDIKGISILVHGTTSKVKTETLAQSVYNKLEQAQDGLIDNKRIFALNLLQNEPVDVGCSDRGIYEYVIEIEIMTEV